MTLWHQKAGNPVHRRVENLVENEHTSSLSFQMGLMPHMLCIQTWKVTREVLCHLEGVLFRELQKGKNWIQKVHLNHKSLRLMMSCHRCYGHYTFLRPKLTRSMIMHYIKTTKAYLVRDQWTRIKYSERTRHDINVKDFFKLQTQ